MSTALRVAAGLTAGILAAGCAAGPAAAAGGPAVIRGVAAREPAADPRPYGAADTAFGLDLLAASCRAAPRSNQLLSPSSLASGLGMAYLGARGATAQAMAGVLHLPPGGGARLAAGLQARSAALRRLAGPGVQLAMTDQVWADPGLPPLRSYLDAVATGYGAGVAQVPLRHHPGQAARRIDRAVAAATRGRIPRLLAPGSLTGTGWVLTDALYLRAAWAVPFPAGQTAAGAFTTAAGSRVSVKYLHGAGYRLGQAAGWTAVLLPYRGGRLAMIALLPPAGAGPCAMPAPASLQTLTATLAAAGSRAAIALPRVALSTRASMKGLLRTLGMGIAFTPAADFTGLSPQACCIGLVQHAATLQVGEKGTVASAATAVGILPTAARASSRQVSFDRPYLLLVTALASGEPLFLARVADPAAR